MRIGFDFHGVLNKYPMRFKHLMISLKRTNTRIILSGPPREQIKKELDSLRYYPLIHYDQIISVVDWLKQSGAKMWQDEKGDWWTDNALWWKSKAMICEYYKITMMYDDKLEYKEHIQKNYTLFLHV